MSQWFEDWFASDQYLNVYKHRDEKDALKLLDLISNTITLPKSDLILDAACGAGRYTNLLVKKGFKVIGFDLSFALLKVALENSTNSNSNDIYFRSDIRSVQLKRKFGLILNVFTSFGYFDTDEENFSFINNSINFLKPGGFFVFDYMNKGYLINSLVPSSEKEIDNYRINERRKIENERVIKEIEIEAKGKITTYKESVKLYSFEKLKEAYERAGYTLLKAYGDFDGNKYDTKKSPRIIMILQNEN